MNAEPDDQCPFCRIVRGKLTPGVLAYHDNQTAVFPSLVQQPRNRGHMLVVPVEHVEQIYGVDGDLAGPLLMTVARVAAAVKSAFAAEGVSIRQNNEPHGGQDIFHVHFHVIPRFVDDGFTGLDRSPGAVEVALDERIDQARKVAQALGQLSPQKRGPVISCMLAVPDTPAAVGWYEKALGARVLWSLGSVAGLEIEGAPFFLHEPVKGRFNSPNELGTTTVRVELFVDDPDGLVARATAAGATGDPVIDHAVPWGSHRQGGFTDPFGHCWHVGDKSPLRRFNG